MINVRTPRCIHCKQQAVVQLSDEEFAALEKGLAPQDACPDRDSDFRELLITGTHAACWNEMFPDDEDEV